MISKTKLNERIKRKTNPEVVQTLFAAKNHEGWRKIAQIISSSNRKYSSVNLKVIDEGSSEGDTIVVPGRVLGSGNLSKKLKICAMGFSESAKEKIKENKSEAVLLVDEIKKNPKAEGVKIIK